MAIIIIKKQNKTKQSTKTGSLDRLLYTGYLQVNLSKQIFQLSDILRRGKNVQLDVASLEIFYLGIISVIYSFVTG